MTGIRPTRLAAALALQLGMLAAFGSAQAQESATATPAVEKGDTLDTVVVTGSRSKRSVGKSSSPIDVISTAELQKTGAATVTEALNDLLPAYNLPAVTGYDQSAIVRPAGLRGLNGDQTLVLVNGKRRHASAIVNVNAYVNRGSEPVDLNLIPFSAIDHIEVLRDGAAAQYGSDAIAGVINIILRSDPEAADASAKVGGYGWKDGLTVQAGATKGFKLFERGFIDISAEGFSQNHTNRSGITGDPHAASGSFYFPNPDGTPNAKEAGNNPYKVVDGLPDSRTYNLGYNAALPLGGVTLYSFSTYSFRHAQGYENFRFANDGSTDPAYNYDPNTGAYTQAYPDGYEPNEVIDENDFSVTAGARTERFGWSWDLSSTYGKDDASVSVVNTLNPTLGLNSPHAFYAGSWVTSEFTNNLDVIRPFDIGLAAPLAVALGAEYRNNAYAVKPGEFGSYGAGPFTSNPGPDPDTGQPGSSPYSTSAGTQAFSGFDPALTGHGYRDSYAGYVDLETKLLPGWDVGIAGRFEHYSDFGNTTNGKFSTRYQLLPELAVRGTVSSGFRAPTLGQSLYVASTTNFVNTTSFLVETVPVNSGVARTLGATPLQPEKSTNLSVGFIAAPLHNLDITLDAYRIYVRHRVEETGQLSDSLYPGIGALLTAGGYDPTLTIQYFTNTASTRTQGLDLVSNYKINLHQYGLLRALVAANWNQTTITSLGAIPPQLAGVAAANPGFSLIDVSTQGYITGGTPRNKLVLGLSWQKGPVAVNLRETRFGHVVDTSNLQYGGPTTEVPATWITSLDASYDLTRSLTLGLGADNLFNRYPPQTSADFQSFVGGQGFSKYDPLTPYGYFGGFYYARATLRF